MTADIAIRKSRDKEVSRRARGDIEVVERETISSKRTTELGTPDIQQQGQELRTRTGVETEGEGVDEYEIVTTLSRKTRTWT